MRGDVVDAHSAVIVTDEQSRSGSYGIVLGGQVIRRGSEGKIREEKRVVDGAV